LPFAVNSFAATTLSPQDHHSYHAVVALFEASCSFGDENSTMIVLAEAEVVMRYPRKGTSPEAAIPSSSFFGGNVPQVRH